MSPPPNDSTKFDLAWMIIWIILSTALLALVVIRKLPVPNLIKGGSPIPLIMAFLQLVIAVFFLAMLSADIWSRVDIGGKVYQHFGVAGTRYTGHDSTEEYSKCDTGSQEDKDLCGTGRAAGAFTLIFGLIGIVASWVLLALVGLHMMGQAILAQFNSYADMLSLIQLVCLQAMMMIWAVGAHDILRQVYDPVKVVLGASWALCFVAMILAVPVALFYAGGIGDSATGPATASSPAPAPAAQPQQQSTQDVEVKPAGAENA